MSAKQFQHFMSLQQQLAGFRRTARPAAASAAKTKSPRVAAVAEAKDWLAAAAKRR